MRDTAFKRVLRSMPLGTEVEMLSKNIPDLQGPIYYIAGPPAMVAAMRQVLTQAAVDEDDIRTEEFAGY